MMISRKRDKLDKNLLDPAVLFVVIATNTLIINTKPVLTKKTFRAMRETSIRVEFDVILSMRVILFETRDKIFIDLDLISKINIISIDLHGVKRKNRTCRHTTVAERDMTVPVIMASPECETIDSTRHGE